MRFVLLILLLLTQVSHADSFLDRLPLLGGGGNNVILPPDKAFGLEVRVIDGFTLQASFNITPGYYLYRDKVSFSITDDPVQAADVKILNVSMPEGEMKSDPNFGDLRVFHQPFQAMITLERGNNSSRKIILAARYQGCKENDLCYAPIDKQFSIMLPEAGSVTLGERSFQSMTQASQAGGAPAQSESALLSSLLQQGNFWLIILFFFGAGLLLAFTPCVLPMIPILSGIIVGRGLHPTKMHGFILSFAYVLGMALTYAAAGVAAGLSGTLLSSALQTPWALGGFAVIFVLLALSMFGFYEVQLPSVLQSKLTNTSNRLHGGHLSGVFVMGALSALMVSPCVAAPMAAALLYIGQTHDAVMGGIALFALAIGMGIPLLVIGASAGVLLPKAGAWMETVKNFFGVVMLAMAIWMISTLIPLSLQMLLWGALLVLSAIHMRALESLSNKASGWEKLWKGVGILALLLGSAYLIGALSGARDILRPLAGLGNGPAIAVPVMQFDRVRNVTELENRISQEKGRTIMLDFYADWCISCKEMERFTFADERVQAKLKHAVLLQIDVTANNHDDQSLLKRFGLFGPPAILFFDRQGNEQKMQRITGYQNADRFLQSLNQVGL
ncbi:protein-disulfide reductase DsbD [Candidatus Nitrotoga fabula]|uniref:Thiol:disulfide interchange protein DsbD n=1 Tax=Candidatus Nitrotoga fabula TaxID=2182327 RepID=A0A916BEH2_9PROT|nr:protein-disulfide reductase DsbD [Candidatus Nitrotoga fabula]CAE6725767.1 Thiol:disulfide interchange protein DsbD [Candidatus Nitrotoga fabula]